MNTQRKLNGYWDDFKNVQEEVEKFIALHGSPDLMPTIQDLVALGYTGLSNAIQRHGGIAVVARQLGLKSHRKAMGYWDDFVNVERELYAFIAQYGTVGTMPTTRELQRHNATNLSNAIQKHGGMSVVARHLGLKSQRKARAYWHDFANVERELYAFIARYGTVGTMPTTLELQRHHSSNLYNAIQRHGGTCVVARKLGLKTHRHSRAYWDDFANVEHELKLFITRHGMPGYMPTLIELQTQGYLDLGCAIQRAGGFWKIARQLGLSYQARTGRYSHDFTEY